MKDSLGDRMKQYEGQACGHRLMPLLPTLARVDGRAFHSFTRGMERPFDPRMSDAMLTTAVRLVKETGACMAYVQSDEITLAWLATDRDSQIWFDGRRDKMVSGLSALATLHFYRCVLGLLPDFADRLPTFDARVWQVPNREEGANAFLWRELDATKNSISMAAHAVCGHKASMHKNGAQKQEMLWQRGVNWNDYPASFKRGQFVQRRTFTRPFTSTELDRLPPKHHARSQPDLTVARTEWAVLDLPPFRTITNREAVIFDGAEAVLASADAGLAPSLPLP